MSIFNRESDGLDSLRGAATALKLWRPPAERKLKAAGERIERDRARKRALPEEETAGVPVGEPRSEAARRRAQQQEYRALNRLARQRARRGAGSAGRDPSESGGASRSVPAKAETRLRRWERSVPKLRWLFRRMERLALAGRPWVRRARRALLKHRNKLIWSFVAGISLVLRSS